MVTENDLISEQLLNIHNQIHKTDSDIEYIRNRIDKITDCCHKSQSDATVAKNLINNHISDHWKLPTVIAAIVTTGSILFYFIKNI